MSARAAHRRRRRGGHEEENEERWLLTYSDMITLLMALFMVLFSISSVNISKYRTLQKALKDAFSGQILPGGRALENTGASEKSNRTPETTATTAVMPFGLESASTTNASQPHSASEQPSASEMGSLKALETLPGARQAAAQQEQASFQRIQHEVESYVASHGLKSSVATTVEPRGLVIRMLTDKLLFASGQATLAPGSYSLLEEIAGLLEVDRTNPISIEGNTDSVPIHTSLFPSNWELSTTRADTIVRFMVAQGVAASRLSAIGYAAERPLASNATAGGRARNRRVEIVLERLYPEPTESAGGEGASSEGASTESASTEGARTEGAYAETATSQTGG